MLLTLPARLFALLAILPCFLAAQDVAGTWQGTLKTPVRDLRVVFKITRNPADEKLQAQMISIDQSPQPIPATVTQQGASVKMKVDVAAISYDGTLSSDGTTINGTFTQGPAPLTLSLAKATPQTAWAIPEPPPPPKGMDPAADPTFEVATIKLSDPNAKGRGFTMRGWIHSDHFDITGKADAPGVPNIVQFRSLIRKILADRFQLKFHNEKKELSVYAITELPNLKHKLTPSAASHQIVGLAFPRLGLLPGRNATLDEIASSLQGAVMDRPVINQTKIEGRYDFTLDWAPDEFQFATFGPVPKQPESDKPDIYRAFQDQLGLKLEATKAPANAMVIDKVEKPSEN